MRKLLFIASLLLLLPLVALAQDKPKIEIFGGYSYLRADDHDDGTDLHGWNASATGNLNKWFGVKADFSGHYGSFTIVPPNIFAAPLDRRIKADSNTHLVLVGPQFAYREHDLVQPFGHVLFGVARQHYAVNGEDGQLLANAFRISKRDLRQTDTAFAFAAGGGVDIKITKYLAWRAVQADYVLTTFDDTVLDPTTAPREPLHPVYPTVDRSRFYCGTSGFASFLLDAKEQTNIRSHSKCDDVQHNFRLSTGLVLRIGDY